MVLLLVAMAALVRCMGLSRLDLGTDEAHSFLTATSHTGILAALHNDTNLPLYFVLLKGWIAVFGSSLAAMRSLSAILGVAAAGALAGLARQCGATWRTTLWTLFLAAFAPVQLHYAQLARGYTLAGLLMTLSLASFVFAIRSRRRLPWAIHGAILILGAWTHALFIPVAAGYVFAALLMRIPARQFLAMGVTYGLSLILAMPAILLAMHQSEFSGGMAWLREYWLATPPALAIPKSLAILALGADMPRYLLSLPLSSTMNLLALALTGCAAGAFFWPRQKPTARGHPSQPATSQAPHWRWLLIVFTFWPLAFLWGYSAIATPIYLVGRYDLFAQPTYLVLLAIGFSRLQTKTALGHRLIRWLPPALVGLVLAAGIECHFAFPLDPQIFHHQARISYLAGQIQPGESILCTGLEASPTLYWLHQQHIIAPVSTFPRETLSHTGWLLDDDQIVARRDQWAAASLAALSAASPNHARVWIFLDSAAWNPPGDFAPSPRQQLTMLFLSTALSNGWRPAETDPLRQAAEADLRIVSLIHDPASTPPSQSPRVHPPSTSSSAP